MPKPPRVWVVEAWDDGAWYPCGDAVGYQRTEAIDEMNQLSQSTPQIQFRVARYQRVDPTPRRRKAR